MSNESEWFPDQPGGAILPAQYFPFVRGNRAVEGEYRLLVAVLEDAVRSYLGNMNPCNRTQRLRFAEAWRWFYPPRAASYGGLFSFESICGLLGINPGVFRRRLGSLSAANLPRQRQRARDS